MEDMLRRQPFIDDVKTIIKHYSEKKKNVTFAINGKWGVGKSFLLKMLEDQLQNDYIVFHYNAWEYDYYDEPLIAIITSTIEQLGDFIEIEKKTEQIGKAILNKTKKVLVKVLGEFCKNKLGVDILAAIQEIGNDAKKQKEKDKAYDKYLDVAEKIKEVKKALAELGKEKSVIFMVDETDRCLPEYAIKVLERLHHLFSGVENLQVILSVDKVQLDRTVKTIFGENTNTEGYLKKFISFELELSMGDVDEQLVEKVNEEYYKLFAPRWRTTKEADVKEFVQGLFSHYDMRTRLKVLEKAGCLHKMLYKREPNPCDLSYLCVELVIIVLQNEKLFSEDARNAVSTPLNTCLSNNTLFSFFDEKIKEKKESSDFYKRFSYANDRIHRYTIFPIDIWATVWIIVCGLYGSRVLDQTSLAQGLGLTDRIFIYELQKYAEEFFQICDVIK